MYSASGDVNSARQVFDDMVQKKNIAWTRMIGGYARNQSPREALLLLSMMEEGLEADDVTIASALSACAELEDLESWTTCLSSVSLMQQSGIQPDDITSTGMLSACKRGGLVKEGLDHFQDRKGRYGITSRLEHYGCMIDLLSRSWDARRIRNIHQRDANETKWVVWGALLSECRAYYNVKISEKVAKQLLEIEPNKDGACVLLTNILLEGSNGKN
ncbi:putative Pentatricopeptide repeat-containing protein [Cocos nucifera]|uniref:Putative Pentatricopeptide repeat-containing protein n=1 Tax=Cocos nucifera TaxID=13894 RepID=A0A8K0IEE6_COCNU|nr:putative Pentatricopeptide repeat-containing protein [Cocos nucifera]